MRDLSRRPTRFFIKALWIALVLGGLIATGWWTDRWASTAGGTARRSADASARAGDVKSGPDGRMLYFNGRQWTDKSLPAQDTPF